MSDSDASSAGSVRTLSESESDFDDVVGGPFEPYMFEPVAPEGVPEAEEEEDEDGFSYDILEARQEQLIPVHTWCRCGQCDDELLADPREFRCCREILAVAGKLADGVQARCITGHPDFGPMTNATVLEQICPLLKDTRGRNYRFPNHGTRNEKHESLRAAGYRFLVRWLFGPLGWENARPLTACIYHRLRNVFPTTATKGYRPSNQR